jgi:glycosyltransferase involved in cell wall biosynthesis
MFSIGVDARELAEQPAGKGQYLDRIVEALAAEGRAHLTLYFKKGQPGQAIVESLRKRSGCSPELLEAVVVRPRGLAWHLAVSKRSRKHDVFFAALSYISAIFNRIPTVTVVHDLAVFRVPGLAHNRKAYLMERLTLAQAAQKSARLIAVSQATANDLLDIVPAARGKVTVIPEAPVFFSEASANPVPRQGVLFVGTLEPRKNISTLLRAYALVPPEFQAMHPLTLIGKKGWGGEDYPALAKTLGIEKNVHFLGYQPNDAVIRAYQHAAVFVYPSLYEGFGLPVVEAMAAGLPVITSTTPALAEVAGDGAILCDPHDAQTFATALTGLLESKAEWKRAQQLAYQRAEHFSWKQTAMDTMTVLQQVIHN